MRDAGGESEERDAFVSEGWRAALSGPRSQFTALGARVSARADGPLEIGISRFDRFRTRITLNGAASSPGELEAGRIVYRGVFPGVDRVVLSTRDALEDLLVLRTADAPHAFSWSVALPEGVARVVDHGAELAFEDQNGRAVLHVAAPYLLDARGERHEARMTYDERSARIAIAFDPSRVAYPCLLDPIYEVWSWVEERVPLGARALSVADQARGEILAFLYQGLGATNWVWNGTRWRRVGTNGEAPAASYFDVPALAYDEDRKEVVSLLAGKQQAWNGLRWRDVASPASPPARAFSSMAFAKIGGVGKVVLFGGATRPDGGFSYAPLDDTWTWDGATWTQVTGSPAPSARYGHAMVGVGDKVVLVGGQDATTVSNQTWYFDGAWHAVADTSIGVVTNGMAVALADRRVLLFGGRTLVGSGPARDRSFLLDTTAWTWTEDLSSPKPAARAYAGFAWDAPSKRFQLFAGTTSTVQEHWYWDPAVASNHWTRDPLPQRGLSTHAMAATADSLVMVTHDDVGALRTWTRSGAAWVAKQAAPGPTGRREYAVAFDAKTNLVVLQGGSTGSGTVNDTWLWNGSTWQPGPALPDDLEEKPLATHPLGGVMTFGGVNPTLFATTVDDQWRLSGAIPTALAWTRESPTARPPPRARHAMAYDSTRRAVIVFGGQSVGTNSGLNFDDTWSFDGTTWVKIATARAPSERYGHSMTFLPRDNTIVLFGGTAATGGVLGDTWIFDGVDWSSLPTRTTPPPSSGHAIGVDPKSGDTVLVGAGASNWTLDRIGEGCMVNTDCNVGFCTDGVCCDVPQCSTCETCAGLRPGKCTPIVGAEDIDSCATKDKKKCSGQSECKTGDGQAATKAEDCASGFLVDGFCCNRACNARCEACAAALKESGKEDGVCDRATQAARPEQSCGPASCDGEHTLVSPDGTKEDCGVYHCEADRCLTTCRNVADCVSPADCTQEGKCVLSALAPAADSGCHAARSFDASWSWVLAILAAGRRSRRLGRSPSMTVAPARARSRPRDYCA